MDGDGVVGGTETNSTGVTGETTLGDIVGRFGTNEEPVATKDRVGSERWSLK